MFEKETELMRQMNILGCLRTKALVAGMTLVAASTATVSASEGSAADWQYGLMIYGWLPGISGDLNYSQPDDGDSIGIDANNIIDALNMTFMGSFEARKGPWSGFTDVIYLDLGGDKSKSVTLPGQTAEFDADMNLTGWLWTLGGAYTLWSDQGSHLDMLAGVRLLSIDTDVDLTGGGPGQADLNLSESEDLWDAIVGVKGRLNLRDPWFMPYYADIGTGDTDLTWQVMAGVGYAFDWGDVMLNYRYLEYDQGNDKLLQNLAFSGAMLGVGWHF